MKKQLLLFAGSILILASCSTDNTPNIQQAQIDSIARAKATLQDVLNKQKNDSIINAIAKAKADSIETINTSAAKPVPGANKN